MDDPYTTLKPGDEGVVVYIDDVANIHINWENGSTLTMINGEDEFSVVVEDDTLTGKWRNEALPEGTNIYTIWSFRNVNAYSTIFFVSSHSNVNKVDTYTLSHFFI